jgi:hypothetical protein
MSDQPAPPDLSAGSLLRVIPVGQQEVHDGVAILLYSLEVYAEGIHAVMRVSWSGGGGMLPRLAWVLRDDRGNSYIHFGCGGSGGGRLPNDFSWRAGCTFAPGITPDARELTLELGSLRLQLLQPGAGVSLMPPLESTREVRGPWRFTIPLAPA